MPFDLARSAARAALAALLVCAACAGEAGGDGGGGKKGKDGGDGDRKGKDAAAAPSPLAAEGEMQSCRIVRRTLPLPEGVPEASGAAVGRRNPRVFWTHNDSGGDPLLFAIGLDGSAAGRVQLEGAEMLDWEDAAAGPCPAGGGSCLYVADIGDNGRKKKDPLELWVAPEPEAGGAATAKAARYRAAYPDGEARDAEAMFVLPDGRVYLVNKGNQEPVELWRWPTPLYESGTAALERIRTLAPEPEQTGDRVTGAAASPDGRWVAVRTYGMLAVFRTADLLGTGDAVLRMDLAPLGEAQGEGVGIGGDGTVVLTSEGGAKGIPGSAAVLLCDLR